MGEKLSVTKIKLLVAALLAALLAVLVFIFFGVQLMKDSKPYDEMRTLCNGVQMLVPAGWEMQKTQAGCYKLSTMFYNKFAFFKSHKMHDPEYNLARIIGYTECGADNASYIYNKYFREPDPEKIAQAKIESVNSTYSHQDAKPSLLSYRIEYRTINGALAASELYVIKRPASNGIVGTFYWTMHFYTPTIGLRLYASCLEKDRPRFEPVFAAIFNSVVLPQNKPCQ